MDGEKFEKKKGEILKELFLSKEDTLQELRAIVDLSKKYFRTDKETGRMIFNNDITVGNKEKICLLLISKYLAKEGGVIKSSSMKLRDICNELKIIKTTLSNPLKILIDKGIIEKNENKEYYVPYYKIKSFFESLTR